MGGLTVVCFRNPDGGGGGGGEGGAADQMGEGSRKIGA